jgi:hypothetical protein
MCWYCKHFRKLAFKLINVTFVLFILCTFNNKQCLYFMRFSVLQILSILIKTRYFSWHTTIVDITHCYHCDSSRNGHRISSDCFIVNPCSKRQLLRPWSLKTTYHIQYEQCWLANIVCIDVSINHPQHMTREGRTVTQDIIHTHPMTITSCSDARHQFQYRLHGTRIHYLISKIDNAIHFIRKQIIYLTVLCLLPNRIHNVGLLSRYMIPRNIRIDCMIITCPLLNLSLSYVICHYVVLCYYVHFRLQLV